MKRTRNADTQAKRETLALSAEARAMVIGEGDYVSATSKRHIRTALDFCRANGVAQCRVNRTEVHFDFETGVVRVSSGWTAQWVGPSVRSWARYTFQLPVAKLADDGLVER